VPIAFIIPDPLEGIIGLKSSELVTHVAGACIHTSLPGAIKTGSEIPAFLGS